MSKLFLDTLDPSRKAVFAKLNKFSRLGVLGGGTAIALQINHRRSFDFDIFLKAPIKPQLLPTPLNANSVVGHLINTVDGDDVETVLVDGKPVVKNRKLATFDEDKAQSIAQAAAAKLWDRLKTTKPEIDPLRK